MVPALEDSGHWSCSQRPKDGQTAPHPKLPEASDHTWCVYCPWIGCNIETPFHESRNVDHHSKSDRKGARRLIGWSARRKAPRSSNIRRINVFPGWTTVHACVNFPTSDSRSDLVHALRPLQACNSSRSSNNLWRGRRIIISLESSSKPRKVRRVHGPSRPSLSKTLRTVARAIAHSLDSGAPITKKSSR